MDKIISKPLWLLVGAYILISFTIAQDVRRLPVSSRRRLPTVIITREHLRQRQNSYGAHGDTAAEFVVSAGLDTSKNSAVRIRRIGSRHDNATYNTRPAVNRFNFSNSTSQPGQTGARFDQRNRTPSNFGVNERNRIINTNVALTNVRHNLNEGHSRQPIDRRHSVVDNDQRIRYSSGQNLRNPSINVPGNQERPHYLYRPPLFVPHFQHNRRVEAVVGIPGEQNRRPPNEILKENQNQRRPDISSNDHYPIYSVKYSTSSVSTSTSPNQHQKFASESIRINDPSKRSDIKNNNKHGVRNSSGESEQKIYFGLQNNEKNENIKTGNTDNLYISPSNRSIYAPKQHLEKSEVNSDSRSKIPHSHDNKTVTDDNDMSEILNRKENTHKSTEEGGTNEKLSTSTVIPDVVPRNPIITSANPDKNILAETPQLRLNSVKIHEFQTRLIRKPSLILTDQITVNELPKKSNRPRFGPRALESSDEVHSSMRRKRQISSYDDTEEEDLSDDTFNHNSSIQFEDGKKEDAYPTNVAKDMSSISNSSPRKGRYNFHQFDNGNAESENLEHPYFSDQTSNSSPNKPKLNSSETSKSSSSYHKYNLGEQFSDGTYYSVDENSPDGDVMSFSDFLASPISEKMRLDRQLIFRDLNASISNETFRNNANFDSRSFRNNTLSYLRKLVAARLLQSILNLSNLSSNHSKLLRTDKTSESITSAEQRQFGIMVNPYEGEESVDSRTSSPSVRVLKGKIVSLNDLPPEIIPIILGTYRPSYNENNENDDPSYYGNHYSNRNPQEEPRITENMIDNAIYALLQNEELLSFQQGNKRAPAYKVNRKSPSTNYVGSLKTNEPTGKPNYSYKPPGEWTGGPRCDRLTDEICLDDSDYPNSAIMSSIYKDKAKFDLMYAEVKVRESQVEGLSRQQETAYSVDHYYAQGSGTNLVAKDYGPSGGFVCPSEVHYARPHRAKNRKGEWKVVVNVGEYTQTLRMEKCLSSGNPCKYVVNHIQSTCSQVYSFHRLLVFNKERGLHIDVFRIPTSCTCHLRPGQNLYNPAFAASSPYLIRPNHFDEFGGGQFETAHAPHAMAENHNGHFDKKKTSFSNTLWAILGGGQQAGTLAQQPQFLDEVQKQISWTNQLKQYPHLMKQISPNQVLKQLLEEEDDDYGIRRHRIRQKAKMDQLLSGGFASHQVPIAVPLPPPPPPPNGIHRRPVVSIAPMDPNQHFTAANDGHRKVIAMQNTEPTKMFSITKDGNIGKSPLRSNIENGHRNVYNIMGPHPFSRVNGYKVHPGMYPPMSENTQIPESSLHPVAPQFVPHTDNRMRPVMKPMPAPQGSNKNIVDDEDLIAAEKSGGDIHAYSVETATDSRVLPPDDTDAKINFSYHPILEYLNM